MSPVGPDTPQTCADLVARWREIHGRAPLAALAERWGVELESDAEAALRELRELPEDDQPTPWRAAA